jgi:hypothetical protein
MLDQLRAKGREVLVTMTAVALLLSGVLGLVGDMLLLLLVGGWGWFISAPQSDK